MEGESNKRRTDRHDLADFSGLVVYTIPACMLCTLIHEALALRRTNGSATRFVELLPGDEIDGAFAQQQKLENFPTIAFYRSGMEIARRSGVPPGHNCDTSKIAEMIEAWTKDITFSLMLEPRNY